MLVPEDSALQTHARLMASALHNGGVNLLSGWCGFWDTSSHFHLGVFLILAIFLRHLSTGSRASKPPEPENAEEQTENTENPDSEILRNVC